MIDRRKLLGAASLISIGSVSSLALAAPSGKPIRIGSSLALTGPLSSAGLLHKIAGEIYVDNLNSRNGLLGRPVEWVVRDDQSRPDMARSLYEQLITGDKVDLLLGPYGTGTILSAMGVAQRYKKLLIHHSFGIPHLAKYEMQFPAWGIGATPETTFPNLVFDAFASLPKAPKTIAVVTSKFPSAHFLSLGAREVAKRRGLSEVLFLEWEFGVSNFSAIAARLKDTNPDAIWVGSIGSEGNQLIEACIKVGYRPPLHIHLYPAPLPMAQSPSLDGALAASLFESHPPFTQLPGVAEFIKSYSDRAIKAGLPDPLPETQAAASYVAWQMFEVAITATQSLDDAILANWLKKNKIDTIYGRVRFDGINNYGDDHFKIKQVQSGRWVTVWPKEFAAPGASIRVKS